MPCCAIRTCRIRRNSMEAKRENISFHKFPKNPQKRLEWVNKIDRPGWVPNDATVVCSKHFTVFDFLGSSKGNKLLKGAIPTLHLHDHVDERTMATKAKERKRRVPKTKNQLTKTSATEVQDKEEEEEIENGPTSEYDAAFEDDKSMDIPLVDIKIETIGEPSNDPELLAQERMVIVEIVKSIMCSLDLLVKSDPDSLRSSNVRDKIIEALFCYHHIVDDKDLNLALCKETDIFDNNDSEAAKEIETVVYDETKDEEMDDSNLFDDFNEDDYPDEDYEEEDFLTDEEDDEWKSLKCLRDKIKRKKNLEDKPPKKRKNIESLRTIKKLVQILQNKDTGKIDKAKKKNKSVDGVKRKYKKRGRKRNELNTSEETTNSLVDSKVKDEIKMDGVPFESAIPRFVCEICDVTLVSEHHLAVHKLLCRRRHFYYGNPQLEDFWNDVKCPLCDVKCNHRGNLGRHYITHRVKDIESAFAPLKEKHLNPNDSEKNMRLLNDFIVEFERLEEENEKQFNNSLPSNQQIADDGTKDKIDSEKSENTNDHKKQTKKISHYLKFNLKKIVYDIDFDKDLYCYSCDLLFNSKDELEIHKKKVNDTDAFVCNHCDKTFDTPTKLIHHAKTHTGLYDKNSLYLHNNSEDMEGCPRQMDFKLYPCKYCLTLYMRDDALRAHRTFYGRHANMRCSLREKPAVKRRRRPIILPPGSVKTNDGKYHCNQCAKDYKNYYLFMEHMASHSDVYSFFCDCGKGFKTKKRLKFHIELVHNKKFDVICEICGLKVLYSSLRRHRKAHSTVKPYTCNYCSKGFKYQDALRGHIRTHTHEKLWKCQYCGVEFAEKRGYNTHINIHEGKTPYKCKLCPSAFVSKLKLNAHVAEHRDCRNNAM